jgi:hypothetical protein
MRVKIAPCTLTIPNKVAAVRARSAQVVGTPPLQNQLPASIFATTPDALKANFQPTNPQYHRSNSTTCTPVGTAYINLEELATQRSIDGTYDMICYDKTNLSIETHPPYLSASVFCVRKKHQLLLVLVSPYFFHVFFETIETNVSCFSVFVWASLSERCVTWVATTQQK